MKIRILLIAFICFALSSSAALAGDAGISGKVRYLGEGVSGVYIEAFKKPPDSSVMPVGSTTSGENGDFELGLPKGRFYLTARKRPGSAGSAGMLYGTTGDLPVNVGAGYLMIPDIYLSDSGRLGEVADSGVQIKGRIIYGNTGMPGAHVYLYPGNMKRGPGYIGRVRSGEGGEFVLRASPGRYTLTTRFSRRGEGLGTVEKDDLVGEYSRNPFDVGQYQLKIGEVVLHEADSELWRENRWGSKEIGLTVIGVVRNEEDGPVSGVYAFLYRDYRMVGKPDAISAPTGDDGYFVVKAPSPGSYYLGVRNRFGGPAEPGELMGVYGERGARAIVVDSEKAPPPFEIVVREVW